MTSHPIGVRPPVVLCDGGTYYFCMSNSTPDRITVDVTIKVTVSPLDWALVHGLLDPNDPKRCNLKEVKRDIQNFFTNLAISAIEETDGTINDIHPDSSTPTLPPALVLQNDGTYLKVTDGNRIPVEIDQTTTKNHSFSCEDGDLLITTDGEVFRRDYQGHYFQAQGLCCGDTVRRCDAVGGEVVDRKALDVYEEYDTMFICADCANH